MHYYILVLFINLLFIVLTVALLVFIVLDNYDLLYKNHYFYLILLFFVHLYTITFNSPFLYFKKTLTW